MLYLIFPFFLFILDCILLHLYHVPFFNCVLAYFCYEFCMHSRRAPLGISLMFLMAESVLFYGQFGLNLLFLAPIMILTTIGLPHLQFKRLGLFLMLILSLIGQIFILEYAILGLPVSLSYTFLTLFATLSVCMIYTCLFFELKF